MDLIIKMTNYSIKRSARLGDIHKIRNIITNMHYTAKKLRHLSRLPGRINVAFQLPLAQETNSIKFKWGDVSSAKIHAGGSGGKKREKNERTWQACTEKRAGKG